LKNSLLVATFYEAKGCFDDQISAEPSEFYLGECVELGDNVFATAKWNASAECPVAISETRSGALSAEAQLTGSPDSGVGVDVSVPVTSSDFTCMKQQGVDYAIVRAWHSTGSFDTNAPATLAAAHSAGITSVDIYMFPCPTCGNAANQVQTMISTLKSDGSQYNKLWFDIEGPQYWSTDTSTNVAFMTDLIKTATSLGVDFGIYTSASQWQPIMGSSTIGSPFDLWYAHYDNTKSFSDFTPFNGWTKPTMKQYNGDATMCGVGVDLDWSP